MFIGVHHTITDRETAFARGEDLLAGTALRRTCGSGVLSEPRQGRRFMFVGGHLALRDYVDTTMGRLQPACTSRSTRRSLAGWLEIAASRVGSRCREGASGDGHSFSSVQIRKLRNQLHA
jgi:hypothetical protein